MLTKLARKINILIVAHKKAEKMLLKKYLDSKAKLSFVHTYEEVVQSLMDNRPDLVVCDAELYGVDSRKIHKLLNGMPCVYISSRDRDSERRKCLFREASYLTKPFTRFQLIEAISASLSSHSGNSKNRLRTTPLKWQIASEST